ncbi:MAG TPA: phytanoyl-CoA dioxygenase family protein [Opitutaceae bacterium]|nr:phytanoyl-CoA dioxygenase family protein [Opitutaceae bacterium]HRJ48615.1 phytanoyl-CoA dioxygenase family protein [Opitutaceae bacterium]
MTTIGQPRLTHLEHADRYGYYVQRGLISAEHLARIREAFARLQREVKPEWDKPFQTYYPNVIEFDDAFADLIDHPGILEGVFQIVGQEAQIYSNEILVSKPNQGTMAWHRDKMSIGRHCPNQFLKLAIFLDHVAVDGGPTGVIPESHFDIYKGEEFYPHKIDFTAGPGDVLAFGAATLHRAGFHSPNRPNRPVIFLTYIPWWMKQPDYYTGRTCEKLLKSATPLRRQLLGVQLRPEVSLDLHTA